MADNLREGAMKQDILTIVAEIRREASHTKTIYGGSDFAPVDYKVLTGSPSTLLEIADRLERIVKS